MFPYQKDMPLSGPPGMPDLPIKPEHIGPPEPPKKKRSTPRKRTVRRVASTRSTVVSKTTGRAAPKVSAAARRAAVKDQPRDPDGKFASKVGKFLTGGIDRMFEPKIPTKLKKVKRPEQRSFSENRTLPPRKKVKRKKPPVPQRSFLGRVFSLFNGDYARWSRRNARKQAQIAAQHGYGIPLEPKKRRRRKRAAQQSNYRRGVLRRFLPFL